MLKIPLLERSGMILAFSLRPISFCQDNYSFQFDADNNLRSLSFAFFCFVLFGIFLYHINHNLLITQRLNYEKISWL